MVEITAAAAPSGATAPAIKAAAAAPAAQKKATGPSISSKWTKEGDLSGGYQKAENPQILLSVQGDGDTTLELERADGGKDQGMICFVYRLTNEEANGYRFEKLPAKDAVVSQTKFQKESSLDCTWQKMTKDKQHYLIVPCLHNMGTELDFKISISTKSTMTRATLKALTELEPSTAAICESAWSPELSGGYQKPDNPQFLLTVKSKSMVKVSLTRSDGNKDQGQMTTLPLNQTLTDHPHALTNESHYM